jgi:hypothetical protein
MAADSYIPLICTPGIRGVRLRALDGHAGIGAAGGGTAAVLDWLDPLLEGAQADELTTADRDRLLAAIYRREFGDRIESTVTCAECGKLFDFHFSLEGLVKHIWEGATGATDGTRWRLPRGEDERLLEEWPAGERERKLMERCVPDGIPFDVEDLEAEMAAAAPLLSMELRAGCPECGQENVLQFDMQTLLVLRLARERKEVARQVHLLASTYKWSREEILSLSGKERRAYSAMIDAERQ